MFVNRAKRSTASGGASSKKSKKVRHAGKVPGVSHVREIVRLTAPCLVACACGCGAEEEDDDEEEAEDDEGTEDDSDLLHAGLDATGTETPLADGISSVASGLSTPGGIVDMRKGVIRCVHGSDCAYNACAALLTTTARALG